MTTTDHLARSRPASRTRPPGGTPSPRQATPVMLTGIALVVLFVLAYFVVDVFLLVFAGVLFAIMLRVPADTIAERTRLPAHWALAAVIALLLIVLAGAAWLFGHTLAEQMTTLARRLPELIEQLRERIADFGWLVTLPNPEEWLTQSSGFIGRGFSVLAATFGAVANLLVVFFTGVFFAAQPGLYCRGLLALVPAKHEQRAAEVMDATAHTLRWWLFGQLCLMLLIGAVTGIGLWLLGVPYAFALAVIAGLLEFIPYIGPVLSAVPAVLVALAESPTLALYVALLYLGIQFFEGNIIQPLVQQRTVYLPPAAILISQVVLGVLIGALGVMLATPLAATVMVWTRMLYVEDALGKRVSAAGR